MQTESLFVVGVSHKTAPLSVREKLSVSQKEQNTDRLGRILEHAGAGEGVLLSTCNRTEVYAYGGDLDLAEQAFCTSCGLDEDEVKKYLYIYTGERCVAYLFRVAAGLDSQVLGEDEILRQVKSAYDLAHAGGLAKNTMNMLFLAAITSAKKIKDLTGMSSYAISMGTIGVRGIKQYLPDLTGRTALIIGSGEMGQLVLKNLLDEDMHIYITVRTRHRQLEQQEGRARVEILDYEKRYQYLDEADVVISCTSSPHYVLTYWDAHPSLHTAKPRVFLDLAVPRDIDSSIARIDQTVYLDVDDLRQVSEDNLNMRLEKSQEARELIQKEIEKFRRDIAFRENEAVLGKVNGYARRSVDKRLAAVRGKLAAETDAALVEQALRGTVNDLLEGFLYRVRKTVPPDRLDVYLDCLDKAMDDFEARH